ncbi:MAG: hypothetical protein RR057_02475 [Clostridia bacterium]
MLAELPAFYIKEINVAVDEDKKAERARGLREECSDTAHGLAFVYGNGRVCVSASNGNFFKLFAEAVSSEAAEEICLDVKKRIENA